MTDNTRNERNFLWKLGTAIILSVVVSVTGILWTTQISQAKTNVRLDTIEADIEMFRIRISNNENKKLDKTSFAEMWKQVYDKLNSIDKKLYEMNQRLPEKK